ncbi:hypothetical protein LCGC14_1367430 [marine sediment metagenome]|uniref:Uncharacterized protein n=1 Tax=marine sediment metagenome TaxID=412755 RepID=A0A0F9KSC5_9ZZZZ
MNRYTLVDGIPTPEPCILKWGAWFETADRRVAFDSNENYRVSTVFLALNHNFGDGPPILFETMVFKEGSSHDEDCRRYATQEEAKKGHAELVKEWLTE